MDRSPVAGAALAAVALLGLAAPAFAGDILQRKDGKFNPTIQGDTPSQADYENSTWTVTDADIESVAYSMRLPGTGRPMSQTQPSSSVMEIWLEPSRYPAGWKEAVDAMNAGNYRGAAEAFRSFAGAKGVHPVVRQKALLNYARAAAGAGNVEQGRKAYDDAIAAAPRSFYARALLREQSRLLMDAGKLPEALEVIGKLLQLPGVTDADKIEARLLQVTVDHRKAVGGGDKAAIQKAMEEFRSIAKDTQGNKDLQSVQQLAKLGHANATLELGNGRDAAALFTDITENASDNAVLASAFNGLGLTFYQQGGKENFEEARRCFLRTVVRHADGAPSDEIAKALYYTAECFQKLQDHDEWSKRAYKEATECIARFPSSPWAEKCKNLRLGLPK